jgi:hypothetical protein
MLIHCLPYLHICSYLQVDIFIQLLLLAGNGPVPTADGEEQIYWLRPKQPSPKTSPDAASDRLTWLNHKLSGKHKVTFDDNASTR